MNCDHRCQCGARMSNHQNKFGPCPQTSCKGFQRRLRATKGLSATSAISGKRKSKGRTPSANTLKKKLWVIFSEYMRRRDADPMTGMVKCVSCPEVKHWKEMDCGHFIPKVLGLSIYFEERNTAAQCKKCNVAFQGNQYEYGLALVERYGQNVIDELKAQQKVSIQIKAWRYLELISEYQQKLKQLPALPEAA